MQQDPIDTKQRVPSSRVLEEVIRQAPAEYVTIGWLTSTLHRHSFLRNCFGLVGAIHVLKYFEKAVHPRWPMIFEAAQRTVVQCCRLRGVLPGCRIYFHYAPRRCDGKAARGVRAAASHADSRVRQDHYT